MKRPTKLRIERLVLRGFSRAQAEQVAAALKSGLERGLAGASAVPPGDAGAAAAEQIMQRLAGADTTPRGGSA
jgi:hypothetical protein